MDNQVWMIAFQTHTRLPTKTFFVLYHNLNRGIHHWLAGIRFAIDISGGNSQYRRHIANFVVFAAFYLACRNFPGRHPCLGFSGDLGTEQSWQEMVVSTILN